MPTQKVIGSKTFTVPTSNDTGWGVTTTAYLLELGTYANQVAIASYDLTRNFKVNSTSVVADGKTVAQYGMESTFVAIKNYSASSAKFGALRLPEFGPAGSDNTYTELSSTNSNLGTFVSHNQINWKLAGGYFYLHSDNPALYSDAALVVQRLNSTNSPINNQTALAAAVADTANLNVDTIILAKTPATVYGKSINTGGSNANTVSNSDLSSDVVSIWENNNLSASTVTKAELETLTGINTGSTIETRLSTLETDTGTISGDVGNLGSIATGLVAKTTESGTDVYASRTITGTANKITVSNGNGVSGNPTLNIGTDVVTLNDTQTLQNKEINTNINTIKGTASTMAHFDGSGNMITTNNVPDSINFPTNEGVESTSAASTLNVGTTNNTTTLNLGTSASTNTINIGTGAGTTNINIGGSGDTVTIAGTLVNVNTTNMDVTDHSITLNKGGSSANTSGAGISLEGGGGEVGYLRSDGSRIGTELKSAARDGTTNIRHSTAAANNILDLTNSTGNTYSFPASTGDVLVSTATQTVVGKQTQTSMAFVAESATVTTANLAPASTPPKVIQRITASTATLGTITNTGGATNSELILVNVSGSAISILNDSGASSTSILTGTGSAISLANNASVIVVYDANSSRWRVVGGSGSGGAGSAVTNNVNQAAHGFSVGNWLYLNGTTYTTSVNTSESAAQPVGVVTAVIDTDNFTITTSGVVTGLSGLTAGAVHYISSTAGAITATKPFIVGQFEAPVGIAISTTSLYVACQIAEPASRYTSNNEQPAKNYLREYANSSVDLGTITNSLGDTLSSSDRSANKTTWGSSNTSLLTIARTTNSELRGSFNYLITEAGSSSGAFIESPLFTLDQVDIGKPVSVSFDVKGNAADGDYQAYIVRYNASNILQSRVVIAGNASSTSPFSAKLPTGTTTFNGFFVPDTTSTDHQYALRIVSNNNSASSLRIDTLFIGPQPIRVGAAINDSVSYTPSASINQGFGTITPALSYDRSGERIRVFGRFTCGTLAASEARLALPDNLTVKITQSNSLVIGRWWQDSNTGGTVKTGTIVATNGQAYVKFGIDDYTNGLYPESARLGTGVASGSGQAITVDFSTPITSWSSNQTQADRSVEEYLFNTGSVTTAGGSDTTSFGYGPNGTPCNVFASSTGSSLSTTLRVRSTQPIQQTDTIVAEVKLTGQDPWYPVYTSGAVLPATLQNGTVYGISLTRVSGSNTDIDVGFGNGGRVTNGATYGSAGAAWSASYLWRVRIIRAGAQVGYPISVRNVVSDTNGTVVPTGYLGEAPGSTARAGTGGSAYTIRATTSFNNSVTSLVSATLNKGNYIVSANSVVQNDGVARNCTVYLSIGGTQVTQDNSAYAATGGVLVSQTIQATPIVITADATVVDMRGIFNASGTSSNHKQELCIIRI